MSIVIYFLFGALTFALILVIYGLTLPKAVHLERSIILNASLDTVFREVADFEHFVTWNPWSRKDPNMKQWFEGEKMSYGSKYSWEGNKQVGKGSMQITHIEANERVEMDLSFGPRGNAKCGFILEGSENKTRLIWYFDSEMGNNPLKRIVGGMMERFIGKDYTEGLNNLSKKLENA